MRIKNYLKPVVGALLIIFFILTTYYYWTNSEDYVSNIFPPQVDNDLKFFSKNVCENVTKAEVFSDWKKINEQALQLNERYSSELLKKASFVIEQLKKNQQIYTQSQGEGQQFQYYSKNLKECVNRTKISKLELEDIKNKTQQNIDQEQLAIQEISKSISTHQNRSKVLKGQQLEKQQSLDNLLDTLKGLLDQKDRLLRSYKNETELEEYQKELEEKIYYITKEMAEQEQNITASKQMIQEQQYKFNEINQKFEKVQNQLHDLKSLEQYFSQDDLYIKEDQPIIEVIQEYSKVLADRRENLKILAEKEKDQIQKQKNIQALNEIIKAQQISYQMYSSLKDIKFHCNQDDCIIGTSLENFKLSDLKEEIFKKQTYFNQIYSEKQQIEFILQKLMQLLEDQNSYHQINKQKLNKLIENQNFLNVTKNKSEELSKLNKKYDELEKQRKQLQAEVDNLIDQANDQQHQIENEVEKYNNKQITIESLKLDRNQKLNEKNQELYLQVKDCIKQKKIYENFEQKQSNLIEKANEIKAVIQTEVQQIESILNEYKVTYKDLHLQQNYDIQSKKDL
ncbi:unnamed protein product [Paramecium sonneborni]|uniref:Uncharacterized protein n=1 Tax=Paramecium sonneborni TaxID=65129 RepID=A0A8S1KB80_9CILI|nr:unnamed protein product [Paramecium sonneborni]